MSAQYNIIRNILYNIKFHSKELCYKMCKDTYLKSALNLAFDNLYRRQINEMMGEFNHFFIIKGVATIEEIELLQQTCIDAYKPEFTVKGILEYTVNIACRKAFVEALQNYAILDAV